LMGVRLKISLLVTILLYPVNANLPDAIATSTVQTDSKVTLRQRINQVHSNSADSH